MIFGITKNTRQYNWQYLYYFELAFFLASDAQRTLIKYQENKISEISKELTNKIQTELHNIESHSNLVNFNPNIIIDERLNSALFMHHRYSSCVGIFSMFESNLKTICQEIIKQKKTTRKLEQFFSKKDGYLQCYWKFLNATYKFSDKKILDDFRYIKKRKNIRNCITHNNGTANNKQVSEFKKIDYISIIEKTNQIIIVKELFLYELIDKIDLFFKVLLMEIDKSE